MPSGKAESFFDELGIAGYFKHRLLWDLMTTSLPKWLKSPPDILLFADLFAGPGSYGRPSASLQQLLKVSKPPEFDVLLGSPLLPLLRLAKYEGLDIACLRIGETQKTRLIACLCEEDAGLLDALRVAVPPIADELRSRGIHPQIHLSPKAFPDSLDVIDDCIRRRGHTAGLVFADPFGLDRKSVV